MRRRSKLPVPPPNPYGAHPGAGWAPPKPQRMKKVKEPPTCSRMIAWALLAYLLLFLVIPELIDLLT
ncbi:MULTISPECIES: hypothetical protein [Streptomyces]|uniref:Uncharacterized protein n=1 Tax=Streptomyces cacaoi TaxID=1898 RepID=A0A4Y3R1I8_STRCI|nr:MULTISPECIES: hypothetical protein [Streptomyces]NNG89682.1 hypothetical protein [Streptomyces cacaoi]GEB51441.1 hypothetical protein SCA03_39920 [Streptomyces cacaoi]